jgi:putative ABC transport system ATP-binding protein
MVKIEARQVDKFFREGSPGEVRALQEVSLEILSAGFTLLTGPSGSGKTTLLGLLGALDRPTRGQILFDGQNLSGCSDVELTRIRRRVGFIFQDFSLILNLPVWENITYPLVPRGVRRADRYGRAKELLAELKMDSKLSARPQELSGGEQQRVAIARALAGEPEVLLADEPTSNLDADSSTMFMALLKAIHNQGKTVILSSHDPQWASVATQVYELQQGRLRAK